MSQPTVSTIEKAYVRGLKEGMRRGRARYDAKNAECTELIIRLKTAKGEIIRMKRDIKNGVYDHA